VTTIAQERADLGYLLDDNDGEAFWMLVRWARNSKVKLPALAVQLVWRGELPWPAVRHDKGLKVLLG